MGHIQYFFLEDWKTVTDFCHSVGIRELYANQLGSHLVVVDDKSEGYVYNPVSVLVVTLVQQLMWCVLSQSHLYAKLAVALKNHM
jgi:hypothetical protein